jgi:hypothetical protein
MRVNSVFRNFLNNRWVVGSAICIVLVAIFLIASSFTKRTNLDLRAKETNIIIRDIGHRLLLQAGNQTSRVLPVTEKAGTFLLQFEHDFHFNHDSLMVLSQRLLPKEQFPSGYTVTVHTCILTSHQQEILFGFQINSSTPSILPCSGRREPRGCYIIEFAFTNFYGTLINYSHLGIAGSMLALSTLVLIIGRIGKHVVDLPLRNHKHSGTEKEVDTELATLGKFLFDAKNQRLLQENKVISLTDKEYKIFELLNANFGKLTSRETLLQVWVNEGVITGRSLDMFISKLRKKLSADPAIRITNIHGKGYTLKIINDGEF